ncbi:leukocyte tyrosine kinase receptor-like, partial [Dendronephthya gigantea]|uniref:leukocyte tyrosine kinase receptor-like n=1 Tax=Dendronephthya gigantea TaxID=151771 RepID=UPI00106A8058
NEALRPSELISSHNIQRLGECHLLCIAKENCYGYNYRVRRSSVYFVNCQLSNSTKKWNKTTTKYGPWVYYEDVKVTEDINECSLGTSKCHVNARCINTLGSHECRCMRGYSGNGKMCSAIRMFHANFTSLGATGRLGPSSLGSYYVGKDNDNMVTLKNGTQFWTVPYTGTYEITAVGAAGGYDKYGSTARGRGAYMRGEFNFEKGDVIKILVGQTAPMNTASSTSGGGGGSFVATSSNTPLIVAGGGGGVENLRNRMENCDANTRTSGRRNQCERSCAIWFGGKNGSGALEADNDYSGGGGGGFYSNGRSSSHFGGSYGRGGEGGRGFIQGGAGGRARYHNAVGGFGGGGGAYGGGGGAGGGGGYSGGASGNNDNQSCGGGGGSYNAGKKQANVEDVNENGDGYVEIKRVV